MTMPRLLPVFAISAVVAGSIIALSQADRPAQAGSPAPAAKQDAPTQFDLDPVHSSVIFRIEHAGVAPFYGRFNEISGSYTYDEADPAASSFEITIPVASIDSNNDGRDRHLKSPDFFNVAEHPEITFTSTKVEPTGEDTLQVTGDLSMLGATNEVEVEMKKIGSGDRGRMGYRSGFDATFDIKRSHFGMNYGVDNGSLGDDVTLIIGLEGAARTEPADES